MTKKNSNYIYDNEDLCEKFLHDQGIINKIYNCPKCGSSSFERNEDLSTNQYMCPFCETEWNLGKGTILQLLNISASQFLACLSLFHHGYNEYAAYERLDIDPINSYRLFRQILIGGRSLHRIPWFDFNIYMGIENNKIRVHFQKIDMPNLGQVKIFTLPFQTFCHMGFTLDRLKTSNKCGSAKKDKLKTFFKLCERKIIKTYDGRCTDLRDVFLTILELEHRYNNKKESVFHSVIERIKTLNYEDLSSLHNKSKFDDKIFG